MTGALLAVGDPALAPTADLRVAVSQVEQVADRPSPGARRLLRFVADHPDAAARTCATGHLTASAFVVDPSRARAVLLFHAKLQRWLQPGGHADGDANLAAVALREATEETGIEGLRVRVPAIHVDVHRVAPPGELPHDHFDVRFLVVTPDRPVVARNHESTDHRWIAAEDDLAVLGADPGLIELARLAFDAAGC